MNLNDCCYMIRQLCINIYDWFFNTDIDNEIPYVGLDDYRMAQSDSF